MSAYSDKLKDPRWQKLRLKVFERDKFACQNCLDQSSTLHCHHLYYNPNTEPWDYPLEAFLTLCESCHAIESEEREGYEKDLVSILRHKGFLVDDLQHFGDAIISLQAGLSRELTSKIIFYLFSDLWPACERLVFDHLGRENEIRLLNESSKKHGMD